MVIQFTSAHARTQDNSIYEINTRVGGNNRGGGSGGKMNPGGYMNKLIEILSQRSN